MSLFTLLTVLWIAIELMLLRRRGGIAAIGEAGGWRGVLVQLALARAMQYARSTALASLAGIYALLACVALGLHSIPLLQSSLAELFGLLRTLDPSFPFGGDFRLPTEISLSLGGANYDAFRRHAWDIVSRAAFVAFVARRLADLVLGEGDAESAAPSLRRGLALNLAGAGAVALLLAWALGPGMSPALTPGGLPLAPRAGIAAVCALIVVWTGSMALAAAAGLAHVERWLQQLVAPRRLEQRAQA